mgnify:CR=1 FL=1
MDSFTNGNLPEEFKSKEGHKSTWNSMARTIGHRKKHLSIDPPGPIKIAANNLLGTMINKGFREMGPELLLGEKHGSLDTQSIGKALLKASVAIAQLVSMFQYHAGLLFLFLHPVDITAIPTGPFPEQQDICQDAQKKKNG